MQQSSHATAEQAIEIRQASIHNLKSISVRLPMGKTTLIIGLSGSGKTSLLRHTLLAEGQRRFMAGVGQLSTGSTIMPTGPGQLVELTGIPPLVDVSPPSHRSPYSTLATLTEIQPLLQILYSQLGVIHCPTCQKILKSHSPRQVATELDGIATGTKLMILSPVKEKNLEQAITLITQAGYVRVRFGGDMIDLAEMKSSTGKMSNLAPNEQLEVVIDRLIVKPGLEQRLLESLEAAFRFSGGHALLMIDEQGAWKEQSYTSQLYCTTCEKLYPPVTQQTFNHRSSHGACTTCSGKGEIPTTNETKSAKDMMSCPACSGSRLNPQARHILIEGTSFPHLLQVSLEQAAALCNQWSIAIIAKQPPEMQKFYHELIEQLQLTLSTLQEIGLDYLSLGRAGNSLSVGEYLRALLVAGLRERIMGVAYILEEPTRGLHADDVQRLSSILQQLQAQGQTLLIADHHPELIRLADHIIELGPLSGASGGEIQFDGPAIEFAQSSTLTAQWWREHQQISSTKPAPKKLKDVSTTLILEHACLHNLQGDKLELPLNKWISVTGISGSGKSSLIFECLAPTVKHWLQTKATKLDDKRGILTPATEIQGIRIIDQLALTRGAQAWVASSLGIWTFIRQMFVHTRYAKFKGWKLLTLSLKNPEFRCRNCEGTGLEPTSWMEQEPCSRCHGARFQSEFLRARFKEKSLADVLDLTIAEAAELFASFARMTASLQNAIDLGLGSITLGRTLQSLSTGELTRVHLSCELVTGMVPLLILLDEPAAGLHPLELQKLVQLFHQKIAAGHTLVCVEHQRELIAQSDLEIVIGPGAGHAGGHILTPA
jgi:excinuclease ABC subunit A